MNFLNDSIVLTSVAQLSFIAEDCSCVVIKSERKLYQLVKQSNNPFVSSEVE